MKNVVYLSFGMFEGCGKTNLLEYDKYVYNVPHKGAESIIHCTQDPLEWVLIISDNKIFCEGSVML